MNGEDMIANKRGNANGKGTTPRTTPSYVQKEKTKQASQSNKKLIRLATVLAYVIAVSLAAIILAIYYSTVWDPKLPIAPKNSSQLTEVQQVNGTTDSPITQGTDGGSSGQGTVTPVHNPPSNTTVAG